MMPINVLVASTSRDIKAEVIAACIAARQDMKLVMERCLLVTELDEAIQAIDPTTCCALVLVGHGSETVDFAQEWLQERRSLVVLFVDIIDDIVRIGLRDPQLESLLLLLRDLVAHVETHAGERVAHIRISKDHGQGSLDGQTSILAGTPLSYRDRPLLQAAVKWIQSALLNAVQGTIDDNGDVHGFSVTRATVTQSLQSDRTKNQNQEAESAFVSAMESPENRNDPLISVVNGFLITPLEARIMLLAFAPELDVRFQRCFGFLLDDMSRRVGTLGLLCSLLGEPLRIRSELAKSGALLGWRIFEACGGCLPAADEPLRVDPFLSHWLLGESNGLENDPRVYRLVRTIPWPGRDLLLRPEEREKAAELLGEVNREVGTKWFLLGGEDPAAWRALLELGGNARQVTPIRVEAARIADLDLMEVEESARRISRLARLTGRLLVIDMAREDATRATRDGLRMLLSTIAKMGCRAVLICREPANVINLLGPLPFEARLEHPLPAAARVAVILAAAHGVGVALTTETAEAMAARYPLTIENWETVMRLACAAKAELASEEPLLKFTVACKAVATEYVSNLAERIDPIFRLDEVVLPTDRKEQLVEIVDHVRLAPRVLNEWKFRDQLPYGRGVTALFFGPSGTGKTMAALGIARLLGIQILRLDLSRVVSKYIGDTEKNIDCVFTDAQRSGSAILIDEADALFGKRSEIKAAHDRYANIEVSYLLQRMEAYEGLAILTTNMRQNLDPAFLRRLRFIVDFPKPDVPAREKIWRQCVPAQAHQLDDSAFHQLARRIDLTGGHIRQITIRAAFIAAAADTKIGLDHIAQAARAEFAKLGMPPVQLDIPSSRRAA